MQINEVNSLAATILSAGRAKRRDWISEKFVVQGNPSVEFNDFLADSQDMLFQLEQMFFRTTGNRDAMIRPAIEIITTLRDRCDLVLERIKISPPEDANESA